MLPFDPTRYIECGGPGGLILLDRRSVDLVTNNGTFDTLYTPPIDGLEFTPTQLFCKLSKTAGTISVPASLVIDNGTGGQNIVAAFAPPTVQYQTKNLVIATGYPVNSKKPLRIGYSTKASGTNPVCVVEFFIFGVQPQGQGAVSGSSE